MRYVILLLVLCGCGTEAIEVAVEEQKPPQFTVTIQDVANKQDAATAILKDNTASLARIEKQLEASLSAPKPNGQEVIKSAPEPPAKANTTLDPLKVATPGAFRTTSDGTVLKWNVEGNWNPTILETSAHLGREHGINTDGMTHQEMADLHAALHDGKTVATKARSTQFVTRGMSCPNGQCPTSTRFVQRRRR